VFPRVASGPAFAALRRGEQVYDGGGACPELVEWVNRIPRSPISRRRSRFRAQEAEFQSPQPPRRGERSVVRSQWFVVRMKARHAFTLPKLRERASAFTLLELLIVIGIIALLMVLIVPAFTTIKSGTDVTSAAYTIKGVLDTARSYAKANNTYTWVGFYEEDVSQPSIVHGVDPCTGCVGRLVMSIVASKDGTTVYDPNNLATIDPTRLIQVGKLTKIENVHLATFTDGLGTGSTFDRRPAVTYDTARIGDQTPPNASLTPFQYPVGNPAPSAQYTFVKAVQFSPRGEARIDNTNYTLKTVAEVGIVQSHGNAAPTPSPGLGQYPGNVVAIQLTGVGGDVKIYRR
jgi:type II secretory pathway pseudopilin PulG